MYYMQSTCKINTNLFISLDWIVNLTLRNLTYHTIEIRKAYV